MKKIAYVIPYFGKLPKNIEFWLISCEKNPTIDWLIFTDDKTKYNYPKNVKVIYMTFDEMKIKIQTIYDFPICLNRAYKLCDYKVAYGEIFKEELKEYDFWGHCDMDMLFGNIRKFITDDILCNYEKIGDQGHSTLYKNVEEVNKRYRTKVDGIIDYKTIFTSEKIYAFDENLICDMYKKLNIKYYNKTIYAHLNKYESSFYLGHLSKEDIYKNKRQIFIWENGILTRYYVHNKKIFTEEYMYIHFWCRPITYNIKNCNSSKKYIMYPDVVREYNKKIDLKTINKLGHQSKVKFLSKTLYRNRKKITIKRILFNIGSFRRYRKRDVR